MSAEVGVDLRTKGEWPEHHASHVAVLAPRYRAGAATGISLATRLAVTLGEALAVGLIWLLYAPRALRVGR